MPNIDDISFAKLVSGGKVYRTTCLIYKNKVDSRWWRKSGTSYSPEDFDDVVAADPDTVILGLGFVNKVGVPFETTNRFKEAGIELEIMDSQPAMDRFNELLNAGKDVVGAFHLM